MSQAMIDPDAFRDFEVASWEKKAEPYHRFMGLITSRVIDPLLDAARVGPGMRLLDVATGPGYAAARAAERGASVVGVDIAHQMVALARKLHPGLEFRHADAERLPFGDGSFNAITGNFVVLHPARPEQATAEFARVLIPGGHLGLSIRDGPERARILGVFVDAVQEVGVVPPPDLPPGPPFFRFLSDDEFSGPLRSAGPEGVAVQLLVFTHRLSGPDELWDNWLAASVRTGVLILGQAAETQRRIRAAFDRLVREYAVEAGLELPVSAKLASGRKRAGPLQGRTGLASRGR